MSLSLSVEIDTHTHTHRGAQSTGSGACPTHQQLVLNGVRRAALRLRLGAPLCCLTLARLQTQHNWNRIVASRRSFHSNDQSGIVRSKASHRIASHQAYEEASGVGAQLSLVHPREEHRVLAGALVGDRLGLEATRVRLGPLLPQLRALHETTRAIRQECGERLYSWTDTARGAIATSHSCHRTPRRQQCTRTNGTYCKFESIRIP